MHTWLWPSDFTHVAFINKDCLISYLIINKSTVVYDMVLPRQQNTVRGQTKSRRITVFKGILLNTITDIYSEGILLNTVTDI